MSTIRNAARGADAANVAVGHRARRRAADYVAAGAVVTPLVLYVAAVVARLLSVAGVAYPVNEGSAYYVAVARNLVEGRGLVTDALWSLATPPLTVPRAAFELWQPMATFVSAVPMTILGDSFFSAQLGHALLGALVAPLCWFIARDASHALGLNSERARTVALGSGVLAMALGPFLAATAIPDSTTPFLVFGLTACILMPRALTGSRAAGFALGLTLGLAYLARLEAIYLAAAFLLLAGRRWPRLLPPVIVGGLLVAAPWLVRNLLAFGTLFPGNALESLLFLTRNEDLFAY
ncbi:MAG TPA: glycosyltransferase family 39 protein, partial [Candidatus Caenarcaniphilales bacterium]|nr:glycosyltransferase family 39 protein [Candidatus Caenarcaniphilales bacterium]